MSKIKKGVSQCTCLSFRETESKTGSPDTEGVRRFRMPLQDVSKRFTLLSIHILLSFLGRPHSRVAAYNQKLISLARSSISLPSYVQ